MSCQVMAVLLSRFSAKVEIKLNLYSQSHLNSTSIAIVENYPENKKWKINVLMALIEWHIASASSILLWCPMPPTKVTPAHANCNLLSSHKFHSIPNIVQYLMTCYAEMFGFDTSWWQVMSLGYFRQCRHPCVDYESSRCQTKGLLMACDAVTTLWRIGEELAICCQLNTPNTGCAKWGLR